MDDDKQVLQSKKCHNLRFLLVDEIEAAGVDILGKIEEKMRFHVPMANEVLEGFRTIQHPKRGRLRAFAGVNTLFFGDFWQLDPTGSKSFMSNPCHITGDPHADDMMSMFWSSGQEVEKSTGAAQEAAGIMCYLTEA